MKKIHPIVAAVCNVVVPGFGYVLIGKRTVFGWLLTSASIVGIILIFIPDGIDYSAIPPTVAVLNSLTAFLAGAAFAYDAYQLAKES